MIVMEKTYLNTDMAETLAATSIEVGGGVPYFKH